MGGNERVAKGDLSLSEGDLSPFGWEGKHVFISPGWDRLKITSARGFTR